MTSRLAATPAGQRVVVLCGTLVATVAASLHWGLPHIPASRVILIGGVGAPILFLALAAYRRKPASARVAAGVAVVVIGIGGGLVRASLSPSPHAGKAALGSPFVGVVRQGPLPGARDQVVVDVEDDAADGAGAAVLARLRGGTPPGTGDRVEVTGRVKPLTQSSGGAAPTRDDGVGFVATGATAQRLATGGGVGGLVDRLRAAACDAVDAVLPAPFSTVVLGVAFGLRRPLSADLTGALQDTGLVHLLVLSGLKVAILARLLRSGCDRLGLVRVTRTALSLAILYSYVLIGGSGAAATRSAVMAAAALLLARDGRRIDVLPLLAVTAAAVALIQPAAVLSLGFQLSYAGTLGIVLWTPAIARRIPLPGPLREATAVTIAAQLATFPISGTAFGVVSLVAPLANALVVPWASVVVVLGILGVGLGAVDSALGWLPLQGAGVGARALVDIAHLLNLLPGAAIRLGGPMSPAWFLLSALCGGVILHRQRGDEAMVQEPPHPDGPRPRGPTLWTSRLTILTTLGMVSAIAIVGVAWASSLKPRLTADILDAGDGVAVLVRTSEGAAVLVDTGSNPAALAPSLGDALPFDAHVLDGVVITGGGRRTTGGVPALAPLRVSELIVPATDLGPGSRSALTALTDAGVRTQAVPPWFAWWWGGAQWRCLPVQPTADVTGGAACALQVAAATGGVLVLGDLDPGAQDDLAALAGSSLHSALLVAPPGGALTPALLAAVTPDRIVVPGSAHAARLADPPGARVDHVAGHSRRYVIDRGVQDG